ncbi:hypothetical protein KAI87_11025 [Myxococcota bacterium]|nr:hypothetical protein [Myxococcota bacterium]
MKTLRWFIVLAISSSSACAWWLAGRPGEVPHDEIIFSHEIHVADNELECASCHEGVEEAVDTSQSFLPKEAACLECHEKEDNCEMCHTDVANARPMPLHESELGFSHVAHVPRVDNDCSKCHPDSQDSAELPMKLPPMSTCLACHNHQEEYDQAKCLHCHPSFQRKPLEAVAEFSHEGGWMGKHGMMARSEGASCEQCHTQSMCAECHSSVHPDLPSRLYPEKVNEPLMHRGDFITTHGMEARLEGDSCMRCHKTHECSECHTHHGVGGEHATHNPHPAGWMNRATTEFHGREARIHIQSCAACHDQGAASNCVECHAVGRGTAGSPHPVGWEDKHSHDDIAGNSACLPCHN